MFDLVYVYKYCYTYLIWVQYTNNGSVHTFGDCGAANTARNTRSFRERRIMPLSLYYKIL